MKRIGIFGGSFDPIHNGHLSVARAALEECGLDEVRLMVSPENPLKKGRLHAPERDRLAMARLAVEGLDEDLQERIKVSDFEFTLPRPSYTVNTLLALKKAFPDDHFVWIAGGDNLASLDRWRSPDIILKDFGLIIYPRPDSVLPEDMPEGVKVLGNAELMDMSSTDIRGALGEDGVIENLPVPQSVKEYIKLHPALYGLKSFRG